MGLTILTTGLYIFIGSVIMAIILYLYDTLSKEDVVISDEEYLSDVNDYFTDESSYNITQITDYSRLDDVEVTDNEEVRGS